MVSVFSRRTDVDGADGYVWFLFVPACTYAQGAADIPPLTRGGVGGSVRAGRR